MRTSSATTRRRSPNSPGRTRSGQIRSNVEKEAMEEGWQRTQQEAATRNASLAQYLIGGDRVLFRNLLIEGPFPAIPARERADRRQARVRQRQASSSAPTPLSRRPLYRPDAGVSADVHISSVMSNFLRGYIETDAVKGVQNLMVETHDASPGTPPGRRGERLAERRLPDVPAGRREGASGEQPQGRRAPRQTPDRRRPTSAPTPRGNLVALVNDFQLEFPAPPQMAKGGVAGGPAKVLRIVSPRAEFVDLVPRRPQVGSGAAPVERVGSRASTPAPPAGSTGSTTTRTRRRR